MNSIEFPKSRTIKSASWDEDGMRVTFRNVTNEYTKVYHYPDATREQFDQLCKCESPGRWMYFYSRPSNPDDPIEDWKYPRFILEHGKP